MKRVRAWTSPSLGPVFPPGGCGGVGQDLDVVLSDGWVRGRGSGVRRRAPSSGPQPFVVSLVRGQRVEGLRSTPSRGPSPAFWGYVGLSLGKPCKPRGVLVTGSVTMGPDHRDSGEGVESGPRGPGGTSEAQRWSVFRVKDRVSSGRRTDPFRPYHTSRRPPGLRFKGVRVCEGVFSSVGSETWWGRGCGGTGARGDRRPRVRKND